VPSWPFGGAYCVDTFPECIETNRPEHHIIAYDVAGRAANADGGRISMPYDRCAHTFFSAVCIAATLILTRSMSADRSQQTNANGIRNKCTCATFFAFVAMNQ
jgi:hypothetical protein